MKTMLLTVIVVFFRLALAKDEEARVELIRFENGRRMGAGHLFLKQTDEELSITGRVRGLTPGEHGFHIHERGKTGDQCTNVGGRFNPENKPHGGPTDAERQVGDLGNLVADSKGVAVVSITDSLAQLTGKNGIIGRSVVVHEKADDLGRGTGDSKTTGNAGARVACGVIR